MERMTARSWALSLPRSPPMAWGLSWSSMASSGVYRWPKDDAIRQALTAIQTAPAAADLVRLVLCYAPAW